MPLFFLSLISLCLRSVPIQMNPVVVLFLALNGVIGFPMDQGAEWRPKDSSPTPASSLTLLHPRTRSLPHFPLATGNDHPATGEEWFLFVSSSAAPFHPPPPPPIFSPFQSSARHRWFVWHESLSENRMRPPPLPPPSLASQRPYKVDHIHRIPYQHTPGINQECQMHTHRFLRLLVPRPHLDLPTCSVAFSTRLIAFLSFPSFFCAFLHNRWGWWTQCGSCQTRLVPLGIRRRQGCRFVQRRGHRPPHRFPGTAVEEARWPAGAIGRPSARSDRLHHHTTGNCRH